MWHCRVTLAVLFCGSMLLAQPRSCGSEPTDMVISFQDWIDCEIDLGGDVDVFRFRGAAGDEIAIQTNRTGGSGQTPCFELRGPGITGSRGNCVPGFLYGPVQRKLFDLPETGTYEIRVWEVTVRETMAYRLYLDRLYPAQDPQPVPFNKVVNARIVHGADVGYFRFDGRVGTNIIVQVSRTGGEGISPCFQLQGPANQYLRGPCVPGSGNPELRRYEYLLADSGPHVIRVWEANVRSPMDYSVLVQCIGQCPEDTRPGPIGSFILGWNHPWLGYGHDFGENGWGHDGLLTNGWTYQVFSDSRGIVDSRLVEKGGCESKGSLRATLDMRGKQAGVDRGEVFLDLVNHPAHTGPYTSAATPLDLTGATITLRVRLPAGSAGMENARNGFQFLFKTRLTDEDYPSLYSEWRNIDPSWAGTCQDLTYTLTGTSPGERTAGFDPAKVRLIGFKVAVNTASTAELRGILDVESVRIDFPAPRSPIAWDFEELEIEKDFRAARQLANGANSVVRIFTLADGRAAPEFVNGSPTGFDKNFFGDFDALLAAAARQGVRVMPVLLDFSWCERARTVSGVQLGGHCDVIRDHAKRQAFLDKVLTPLVERYRYNEWIYAWDIINEPEWVMAGVPQPPPDWLDADPVSTEEMRAFVRECAQRIHQLTPHKVTVGSARFKWLELWKGLGLDLYQAHWYDHFRADEPFPWAHVSTLKLDKPVLIGEAPTSRTQISAAAFLDGAVAAGAQGLLFWSFRANDDFSNLNAAQIPCEYNVSPSERTFAAPGETRPVYVQTRHGCPWSVAANAPFAIQTAVAGGSPPSGSGTVNVTVGANPGTARAATIDIAGVKVTINQMAACAVTLNASAWTPAATGAATTIFVSATCPWEVATTATWIRALKFPAAVAISVDPNFAPRQRNGVVHIGSQTLTLTQSAAAAGSEQDRIVRLVFFQLFGRSASTADVQQWLPPMSADRAGTVHTLFTAPETDLRSKFIARLYRCFLRRAPDYGGWIFQRNAMAAQDQSDPRQARYSLAWNFLNSREFELIWGKPTNREFVRIIYRCALGREPSPAEVDWQVGQMSCPTERCIDRQTSMALDTLLTPEATSRLDAGLGGLLIHHALLLREAHPAEVSATEAAMSLGKSLRDVIADLVSAPGFEVLFK